MLRDFIQDFFYEGWLFTINCNGFNLRIRGNSTILNQLIAGSIIVRAIKSMIVPSLPLRVQGPLRSTHNALHGTVITVLGGRCPYLSFCFLLSWHALHDFVRDQIEVRMPFQYIVALIVSSSWVCPGCCRYRFNSLTAKSIPAGIKLVLFGRYVLNIYVGIVWCILCKTKTPRTKIYLPTQRTNRQILYNIN